MLGRLFYAVFSKYTKAQREQLKNIKQHLNRVYKEATVHVKSNKPEVMNMHPYEMILGCATVLYEDELLAKLKKGEKVTLTGIGEVAFGGVAPQKKLSPEEEFEQPEFMSTGKKLVH